MLPRKRSEANDVVGVTATMTTSAHPVAATMDAMMRTIQIAGLVTTGVVGTRVRAHLHLVVAQHHRHGGEKERHHRDVTRRPGDTTRRTGSANAGGTGDDGR